MHETQMGLGLKLAWAPGTVFRCTPQLPQELAPSCAQMFGPPASNAREIDQEVSLSGPAAQLLIRHHATLAAQLGRGRACPIADRKDHNENERSKASRNPTTSLSRRRPLVVVSDLRARACRAGV